MVARPLCTLCTKDAFFQGSGRLSIPRKQRKGFASEHGCKAFRLFLFRNLETAVRTDLYALQAADAGPVPNDGMSMPEEFDFSDRPTRAGLYTSPARRAAARRKTRLFLTMMIHNALRLICGQSYGSSAPGMETIAGISWMIRGFCGGIRSATGPPREKTGAKNRPGLRIPAFGRFLRCFGWCRPATVWPSPRSAS